MKTRLRQKDIDRVLRSFPRLVKKKRLSAERKRKFIEKTFGELVLNVHANVHDKPASNVSHPWRLCPPGRHWVRTHPLKIPANRTNSATKITDRKGHCANNPSGLDQLYPDEIEEIASRFFKGLAQGMAKGVLPEFKNADAYDDLICGWTTYWNETLNPSVPLSPSVVKALIATESGFRSHARTRAGKNNFARGLMQITDSTRNILRAEKGELKDNLVNLTDKGAYDPNLNIAAGTRWLFQKKKLASLRLKREATWEEAVEEYKSYLDKRLSGKSYNKKPMKDFNSYLKRLAP